MQIKLGAWSFLLTRHLCTCDVKNCKILDKENGCIRGCYKGNYFILEKNNENSERCSGKVEA